MLHCAKKSKSVNFRSRCAIQASPFIGLFISFSFFTKYRILFVKEEYPI